MHQGYVPLFLAGFSEVEVVGTCERLADTKAPVWSRVHLENVEAFGCATIAYDEERSEISAVSGGKGSVGCGSTPSAARSRRTCITRSTGPTANAAAGEDIRILHRDTWADTPFGERPPDYYLLDDRIVAVMHYDAVGHWLGGELTTDPAEVARYRQIRDQAVAAAVPLGDYLAALRRAPWPPPIIEPAASRTSA